LRPGDWPTPRWGRTRRISRAARAARAIGQLAARHQVVFFTCHPEAAKLLDPDGVVTQRLG